MPVEGGDVERTVAVDKSTLRRMFNEGRYYERVQSGELSALTERQKTPSPRYQQPPGTVSEEVAYFDGGIKVARVHQFVLPDGTIGASGRPDPKAILREGVLYVMEE